MSRDVIIRVKGVSKKFTRSLKQSMLYGVMDIARDLFGLPNRSDTLRPGEFWALDDVSFEVQRGEVLGIIGPNGAGKSTLLKMLNGIIMPDKGEIEIRGRVGALIEVGAGFHPMLTGRENIYINGAILGMSKKEIDERFDKIVTFAELGEFIDTPVKFYSSGMYVRLGFSIAAHMNPDILLIDEILSVGDVSFQSRCFNRMGEIKSSGAAIILVSHNMHHISRFCDRVLYLNAGHPICLDDSEKVIAHFVKDMFVKKQQVLDGSDFSKVYGNGKVVIKKVLFLDSKGREVNRIQSGESVILRVWYERVANTIRNPILDVLVRDQDGIFFQGSNKTFGYELGELSKDGFIDICFENIVANNQVLTFFIALWNSDMTELYDWKRYIPLEVVGHPLSTGRVLIKCQWQNVTCE